MRSAPAVPRTAKTESDARASAIPNKAIYAADNRDGDHHNDPPIPDQEVFAGVHVQ
jgi:hypothetical protein